MQETFTPLPTFSERFTSSAALQYYQLLPSLDELIAYIQQKICSASDSACQAKALSLIAASYLDLDYDSISHALVVTIFRHEPPPLGTWNETFIKLGASSKVEVGVLTNKQAIEPDELSLGGFLTVIGKDKRPSISPIPISSLDVRSTRNSPRSNPFFVSFPPSPIPAAFRYHIPHFPSYSHGAPSFSPSQLSIDLHAGPVS